MIGVPAVRAGSFPRPHGTNSSAKLRPSSLFFLAAGLIVTAIAGITGGWVPAAICCLITVVCFQLGHAHQLRRRGRELERLAFVDQLTGLANQRAFWDTLGDLVQAADETEQLSLVMLDLDHFKQVNDNYGHPVGDAVLRSVAIAAAHGCRSEDLCFRTGGEELAIIVAGEGEAGALVVAERVRHAVMERELGLPAMTVSAGVAAWERDMTVGQLVGRADRALREAKLRGRNRVEAANAVFTQPSTPVAAGSADAARHAALELATAALLVRDGAAAAHTEQMVEFCELVCEEMGIAGLEREQLLMAARLHDIGKMAGQGDTTGPPVPASQAVSEELRQQALAGERILRAVPELAPIATLVRHVWEHHDGGGYPDGLVGHDIPLASRVIHCIDAFVLAGGAGHHALSQLRVGAGGRFDPQVVAAIERVIPKPRRTLVLDTINTTSNSLVAACLVITLGGSATALAAGTGKLGDLTSGIQRLVRAFPVIGHSDVQSNLAGEGNTGPIANCNAQSDCSDMAELGSLGELVARARPRGDRRPDDRIPKDTDAVTAAGRKESDPAPGSDLLAAQPVSPSPGAVAPQSDETPRHIGEPHPPATSRPTRPGGRMPEPQRDNSQRQAAGIGEPEPGPNTTPEGTADPSLPQGGEPQTPTAPEAPTTDPSASPGVPAPPQVQLPEVKPPDLPPVPSP